MIRFDDSKPKSSILPGDIPGYSPAFDEEIGPISLLQKVFVNSYGMKKYLPTIMKPSLFSYENDWGLGCYHHKCID